MKLINAQLLNAAFEFEKTGIEIENGRIVQISDHIAFTEDETVIDCTGYRIVPGFVDIHIHGCAGSDTMDAAREAIENMAGYLVTKGVTSFCPTTMSAPKEEILAAVRAAGDCMKKPCAGAAVVGVNMEGPFLSAAKKGAQQEKYLAPPDFSFLQEAYTASGEALRIVTVAPELENAMPFIEQAAKLCTVSLGHTRADYETAKVAADKGARHITHLFNAMPDFLHRQPGAAGAAFEDERISAELICDGHHVHPSVLKSAFRLLGDRAVVVSDAMRAAGMPTEEEYTLGGQPVTVQGDKAMLADGTLAGSVTNLHEEICRLVSFGVPLEQAIKAATLIPARVIGMADEIGSLAPGKRADLVILDENLEIAAVYHE